MRWRRHPGRPDGRQATAARTLRALAERTQFSAEGYAKADGEEDPRARVRIAVVGVAGVLAFSVSARTREFGIRLAIGSAPRHLLTRVLREGAVIAGAGIAVGAVGGVILARIVGGYIPDVRIPGALPIVSASAILVTAAILASLMPAARAARVDVLQALRSE
jgi:ABC-type antimicrobial peptide transport system permease subunit